MSTTIILDGKRIKNLKDFFDEYLTKSGSPTRETGINLAAWWDDITSEGANTKIIWMDHEHSKAHLGADFDMIVRLTKEADEYSPRNLTIELR